MLVEEAAAGSRVVVRGVYIQDVVLPDGVSFKTDPAGRAALAHEGITVCETYVDAALDLHSRVLLLPPSGLRRVAEAAVRELSLLRLQFATTQLAAAWNARCAEHRRACRQANAVLQRAGLAPVDLTALDAGPPSPAEIAAHKKNPEAATLAC